VVRVEAFALIEQVARQQLPRREYQRVLRPIEVSAGSSSSDIRSRATFTVTGQTRAIRAEDRAFLSVAKVGAQ